MWNRDRDRDRARDRDSDRGHSGAGLQLDNKTFYGKARNFFRLFRRVPALKRRGNARLGAPLSTGVLGAHSYIYLPLRYNFKVLSTRLMADFGSHLSAGRGSSATCRVAAAPIRRTPSTCCIF